MNPQLEQKLFDKYPKIFGQKDLPITKTCMCWGIDCSDGWFWLLDNLCDTIQKYIDGNKHIKDLTQVEAIQVKEKYGGLRFYVGGGDTTTDGMIWFAESLSYKICEQCGTTENVTSNNVGWILTLCDKCRMRKDIRDNQLGK